MDLIDEEMKEFVILCIVEGERKYCVLSIILGMLHCDSLEALDLARRLRVGELVGRKVLLVAVSRIKLGS